MNKRNLFCLLMMVLLATLLALAGCDGDDGDDGAPGEPGTSVGTVTGTVTNSATDSGEADVTVTAEPGGTTTQTDAEGTYTMADMPIGVYMLAFTKSGFEDANEEVSVVAGETATMDVTLGPTQDVILDVTVDGDAEPGNTLTATVTATPLDGSTVQSVFWSQSNSVTVEIVSPTAPTTNVILPGVTAYKDELFTVLAEPPISGEQLPPNVPLPEGEFPGGIQDRFEVVGVNPFALEETGLVTLMAEVTTSSGTYTEEVEVHTTLPWKPAAGIQNVPIGIPVLLHGKDQASYDWALATPTGSSAALTDATTQNPYYTPDVSGLYTVTVTDMTVDPAQPVTLDIYGGTWEGVITGQDADGRPLAANCTTCHSETPVLIPAPDLFTPWMETGHAEIFTNNLNTSSHYNENCFVCHTVGYDPEVANNGMDDAADYQDFLDSGLLGNPSPDNWTTMLADFPDSAQLANIQCENCHGPQNGGAHTTGEPRDSLASDVCAVCHGEPLRHARFQQWQLSGHANYELAIDESQSGNCSRCHTVNGFLTWLPNLLDDDPSNDNSSIDVTWTEDEAHPQTCVACHDPHSVGTTTGVDTDSTTRISGNTPLLIAGFQVFGAGNGAICMTCHNSRRGLRNDLTFNSIVADNDQSRAPHGSAQTDVLVGQNAYLVQVGIRGNHGFVEDTCVNCHMEQTPPPELLSYNLGGSNHTFFARDDICSNCHGEAFNASGVQEPINASLAELLELVEAAFLEVFTTQTGLGRSIDFNGLATINAANLGNIANIEFSETRGRQALAVTFTDGSGTDGLVRMNDIDVVDGAGTILGDLYQGTPGNPPTFDFVTETLIKAGWNWNLINNDGSQGVHNPSYANNILVVSIAALRATGVMAGE